MPSDVAFLPPSVVQLAKLLPPSDTSASLKDLQLAHVKHVLIPVNDHDGDGALGGSHWGLLAYSRYNHTFQLYTP
jgi:hypothetical protein